MAMTKVFHCVIFFALSRDLRGNFGNNQLELRTILKATCGVRFLRWGLEQGFVRYFADASNRR